MIRYILTILLVAGFSLSGAAQKTIVNSDYQSAEEVLKIALMPYFSTGSEPINQIFVQTFDNGRFSVSDTGKISYNLLNNEAFNNSLRKAVALSLDNKSLKKSPNLYSELNAEEIADFKNNFLNADINIIGSPLEAKKVTKVNGNGNIYLSGNIAAFDLRSGEFILQCSEKVKSKHDKISHDTPYPVKELIESLYACLEKNLK